MLATWNLAPIAIDSCAKGVIMILSTAQFAAVPIVRLASLNGTWIRHHAIVSQIGVVINASPRSVPNVTLYLYQDCVEERMVTSQDSITYCDNCTQLQSCAVCTCPYIPSDGADNVSVDTMCLDCTSTGMEVVSKESLDNGTET